MNHTMIIRWLSLLLNFIVRSNFVIASSGGILITGIAKTFGLIDYLNYGLFGFFSIFFVYNGQRLYEAYLDSEVPNLNSLYAHRLMILTMSIISFCLAVYFLIQILDNITIGHLMIFGSAVPLTFFYVVPIGSKNIGERPHLKAHATALSWTGVIVVFPMINGTVKDWLFVIIFSSALYCYFLAITISFDIRDLKCDPLTRKTVPQVVGTANAKIIAILLLLFTGVSIGMIWSDDLDQLLFVTALVVPITLIAFARKSHHDFYYTILIDGSVSLFGISFLLS